MDTLIHTPGLTEKLGEHEDDYKAALAAHAAATHRVFTEWFQATNAASGAQLAEAAADKSSLELAPSLEQDPRYQLIYQKLSDRLPVLASQDTAGPDPHTAKWHQQATAKFAELYPDDFRGYQRQAIQTAESALNRTDFHQAAPERLQLNALKDTIKEQSATLKTQLESMNGAETIAPQSATPDTT
ncbi:MAG TPA: hypothetical protein ENN77_00385, partial [Candidatus Wirthbacteria bacterium]|nr:hypothetical protein [Candidatus Wirthbacteria bacterium]